MSQGLFSSRGELWLQKLDPTESLIPSKTGPPGEQARAPGASPVRVKFKIISKFSFNYFLQLFPQMKMLRCLASNF